MFNNNIAYNYKISNEEKTISFQDNSQIKVNIYKNQSVLAPLFLIIPALGVEAIFYKYIAASMVNSGWNVVVMDLRGTGTSSVQVNRHSVFGFHEILSIDFPKIIEEIKIIFPDCAIYLVGHSLGGQLALLYSSIYPRTIDGVVLLTGGSNYYKNLKFVNGLKRLINYRLIQILTFIFGYFPGHKFGFAGKESKQIIKDWLRESLTGKYKVVNSPHDFETLLKKIVIPVLFITLAGDKYVTPKCAGFLAEKLSNAKISKINLTASDYNLPEFSHFNWKKTPEPLAEAIKDWLET